MSATHIFLLTIVLLLGACTEQTSTFQTPNSPTVNASVITITAQPIREPYYVTGTLVTDDRVEIASRIIGAIKKITVREGDKVTKGQLLLEIDPTELQAQLSEAKALLAQARARFSEARDDLARYQALFERKLVAENVFHKVELDYQLADEAQRAAKASLDRVKVQMEYAEIHSPVSGVIIDKMKQAGDMATPGNPILTIENPENIVLKTFINEGSLSSIQIGDRADIEIEAAALKTSGTVIQMVPAADPVTRSYLVKIALAKTNGIRTGMFARAEFIVGYKDGISIPRTALVYRADLPGVYIVDDGNIAHFRMVRTGRELNEQVEIVAGLRPGDRLITDLVRNIHSGARIAAQSPAATE